MDEVVGGVAIREVSAESPNLGLSAAARAAEQVPDLSHAVLAQLADQRPARSRVEPAPPVREWARYALLAIALTQLLLALPGLVLGDQSGASTHLARELGSWDLSLSVAWLVVSGRRGGRLGWSPSPPPWRW